MQEVTLPPLKPTKRFKKNRKIGRGPRTWVDPRRHKGNKNLRDMHKALALLDQALKPQIGPIAKKEIKRHPAY